MDKRVSKARYGHPKKYASVESTEHNNIRVFVFTISVLMIRLKPGYGYLERMLCLLGEWLT